MSNEYPTDEELEIIRNYDCIQDPLGLIDYIGSIWWTPSFGFKYSGKKNKKLELHTGGWSGNEEIIGELMGTMFWIAFWEKSYRGGHYYFKIPYYYLKSILKARVK